MVDKGYEFTFGKFEGLTVEDVSKLQPDYLIWCKSNIGWFDYGKDVEELVVDGKFKHVTNAIIKNLY